MPERLSYATVLIGKNILLREGLAKILRSTCFRVLASVSSAEDELASKLEQDLSLFIVIQTDHIDITLQHIERIRDQHLGGRIAVVAHHVRPMEMICAFRAGATGYFVDVTGPAFVKSLELVMMGGTIFPLALLSFVLDSEHEQLCEAAGRSGKQQGNAHHARERGRSAAFFPGGIGSALPDQGRPQQAHRAKDGHRRSDREGARQGDPLQDGG